MRWGEQLEFFADAGLEILFTCRRLCPIKRLMLIHMSH